MENYEWAKEMNCAVTVCDAEGTIIYMNDKSRETYKKEGDLVGKNLYACHSERSREIIRHLLATGGKQFLHHREAGTSQGDLPNGLEERRQGGWNRRDIHGHTCRHAPLCERIGD